MTTFFHFLEAGVRVAVYKHANCILNCVESAVLERTTLNLANNWPSSCAVFVTKSFASAKNPFHCQTDKFYAFQNTKLRTERLLRGLKVAQNFSKSLKR